MKIIRNALVFRSDSTKSARAAHQCQDENVEPRLESRPGVTFCGRVPPQRSAAAAAAAADSWRTSDVSLQVSSSPALSGREAFYFFVFTTPACFCVRACVRVGKRVKPFTAGFYRCASPSWCQIKHEPRDQWHAHPCIRAYVWFYCPAGGKSHFS